MKITDIEIGVKYRRPCFRNDSFIYYETNSDLFQFTLESLQADDWEKFIDKKEPIEHGDELWDLKYTVACLRCELLETNLAVGEIKAQLEKAINMLKIVKCSFMDIDHDRTPMINEITNFLNKYKD